MKQTVLFDFDYTLLDTVKCKKNTKTNISQLIGVSLEEFLEIEKGYVIKEQGFTDFIPKEYINFISTSFQKDRSDISKAFFDEKNFENVLFPDVIEALNSLSELYDMGIFSESFKEFQLLKLHRTGVLNYFNPDLIFIYSRKLSQEALNSLPDDCFIIDDKPSVISGLIESGRFKPIWLNRKTQEEHEKCVTIFDLKNLKGVLENYSSK